MNSNSSSFFNISLRSHPVRGAWIEITLKRFCEVYGIESHPVRGAWIEILVIFSLLSNADVASRKGCVD